MMIMKDKILSAEEFILKSWSSVPTELEDIKKLMTEFAKMHVVYALGDVIRNSEQYPIEEIE